MKSTHTKLVCYLKSIALLTLFLGGAVIAQAADLIILRGTGSRVAVDGIRKVTVANPAVIDARPALDGQSVLVTGVSEGTSELRIERLQGPDLVTNVVVHSNLNQMVDQIKDLLSDVDGLNIKVVGDKIVLRGNIVTKSDYEKVEKVVGAYASVILNMSTFDRSEMNKYVEQAILQEIGLDTITCKLVGDTVILEGIVYTDADSKRAEEIAKLKNPTGVRNLLKVQDVMIETDVQFVQMSRDKTKNMGENLLANGNSLVNYSGSGNSASGGFKNLPINFGVAGSAHIQAELGSSVNKIVASPHLSTKNGEVGTFQQGGTKYIKVSGTTSGDLKSVDYGVILKVKPTLQGKDRVLNEVSIEVSIPSYDNQGNLSVQKYDTTCTSVCKVGESMVLSGITQQQSNSASTKTPGLGDVPLVDLFFSNRTGDRQHDEFVIVVTRSRCFPPRPPARPLARRTRSCCRTRTKTSKTPGKR